MTLYIAAIDDHGVAHHKFNPRDWHLIASAFLQGYAIQLRDDAPTTRDEEAYADDAAFPEYEDPFATEEE